MVWRIDNSSAIAPMPAIPAAGTEAFYSEGNPQTGTPATIVDAWWLNMIQEEIRNVVVGAGISPNKFDNSQLSQAIQAITGGSIYLPLAGGTMTGIIFFNMVVNPPAADDTTGARISLRGGGAGEPDFAIGIAGGEFWFGVPDPTNHFSFYGGTGIIARVPPNGSPPTQPYDLVTLGYLQSTSRIVLSSNHTYYVDPGGSDTTGNGSAANPWATPQFAVDWVQANIDFAGYNVFIQLNDGTYTSGVNLGGVPIGATAVGELYIQGDSSNWAAVTIAVTGEDCIVAQVGASAHLRYLTLRATASGGVGGHGITASNGSLVLFERCQFDVCSAYHLWGAESGSIVAIGPYTIIGGAQIHAFAYANGSVQLSSNPSPHVVVTLTGTPNFSQAFAYVSGGSLLAGNNAFSGGATGARYYAELNGVIFTGGQGANYFPGSVAGATATGGQYQ